MPFGPDPVRQHAPDRIGGHLAVEHAGDRTQAREGAVQQEFRPDHGGQFGTHPRPGRRKGERLGDPFGARAGSAIELTHHEWGLGSLGQMPRAQIGRTPLDHTGQRVRPPHQPGDHLLDQAVSQGHIGFDEPSPHQRAECCRQWQRFQGDQCVVEASRQVGGAGVRLQRDPQWFAEPIQQQTGFAETGDVHLVGVQHGGVHPRPGEQACGDPTDGAATDDQDPWLSHASPPGPSPPPSRRAVR